MFFGKSEFVLNADVAERAQRDAREAIRIGVQNFGIVLDGTVDSIKAVDEILDRIHHSVSASDFPKEMAKGFARIFGSYFGEILRLTQGATWGIEQHYSDRTPAMCIGLNRIVFSPLGWASERINERTGRDLRACYEILVRSIQTGEEKGFEGAQPTQRDRAGALPGRLYTLRHDQGYFHAGTSVDGRQILAGLFFTGLIVLFFDASGNLLGYEVRPPSAEATFGSAECEASLERAWEAWKDEIGFEPVPIRVRRFSLPEQGVGIEDRPGHYEEFLKAPELEEPDEEVRQWMLEQIRNWEAEGSFVLYWGNDLWLDAEGEVTSS